MHQIVLLTALTATTGLFGGGGRSCGSKGCGMPSTGYSACAPSYSSGCGYTYGYGGGYSGYSCQPGTSCGTPYYGAPGYSTPQVAPAPQMAPQTAAYYPSYYSAPPAYGCAGGNCYGR